MFANTLLALVASHVDPYKAFTALRDEHPKLDLTRFHRAWNFAVSAEHGLVMIRERRIDVITYH